MRLKNLFLALLVIAASLNTVAQEKAEFKPSGKVNGKVFFNYHYDMTEGVQKESSFEIQRAYLGYKYHISKDFTASVTFDVGHNEAGSDYTAYLKKAQLEWEMSPTVKLSLGMIGLEQFSEQEKFWGYRYIMKSFADQYGFGSSADLGVKANIKIIDNLYANAFIINGEGYKKIQDEDGKQKFGADLVFKNKALIVKFYADANTTTIVEEGGNEKDVTVSALAAFVGYQFCDYFRMGAEYNQLINGKKYSSAAKDHDMEGLSVYSTYTVNKKVDIFGRYDYLTSNKLDAETEKWNLSKNGSAITTGVQYAPTKGVKMAFNYQGFMNKDSSIEDKSLLFVNFEFKF
jgi:hypothetical protein